MKKTLSLILALLMTLSCASAIFAADPAITDTAAPAGTSAYADAIEFLVDKEIMKGYDNGELGAEDDVQRYQMALFIGRILTGWTDDKTWENGPENSSKFTDLAGTGAEACYGALSYVQQKGIIEGYGDGKFGPEDQVKYQDVLTMAVRALGYQNLEYPWGYIEKAINLGITENVKGVAYTAAAKRGEVAQVVYDTLFAETTKGDTLALRVFGVEFGWETVIITATEKVAYEAVKNAKAPKGTVGFKVLNADGTLGEDVYYVNAKALGLDALNAAEIALGRPYKVFFEIDANSDLVKVNKYVELYDAENIVWNEAGNDQIAAFLKGYTLVSKYAEGFSAGNANIASKFDATYDKKDIIVKGDLVDTTYAVASAENYKYAINWTTGDVLEKQADGSYKTIWHWNDKMQTYYAIKETVDVDGNKVVIGIDYMDEKDAAALRADYNAWFVEFKEGYALQSIKDVAKQIGSPAYAMLETYDLNGDDTADYALYEEFRFGYMTQGSKTCSCSGNPSRTTLKVQSINTLAEKVYAINNPDAEVESTAFEGIMTNSCATHGTVFVNAEYAPVKLLGTYKGFVVYNYNPVTGEVKIVKEIKDLGSNTDAKSYITTGVVVSYDIAKGTVNVQADDGTIATLELGYDALEGADFQYLDKGNYAAERVYADYFYSLYNQYVKYVVVDGKLVYMTIEGAKDYTAALIVKEFAGISTDGYILVDAYNLANLKLERFRIATFDGYKQGDLFYNYKLTQAELQKMFAAGTIYKIDSYVPATQSYNVHVAGSWNGAKYVYADAISLTSGTVSFENAKWGYASFGKMTASDKYVIIGEPNGKSPIRLYTGIVTNTSWKITGDYVKSGSTYIFFNIDEANTVGFKNEYKTQLVLYTGNAHVSAIAPSDEVLGAVNYKEIYVYDLNTAKYVTVKAENAKLQKGYFYIAVDGVIIDDTPIAVYDDAATGLDKAPFAAVLADLYGDNQYGNAQVMLAGRIDTNPAYDNLTGTKLVPEQKLVNFEALNGYGTANWRAQEYNPRYNEGMSKEEYDFLNGKGLLPTPIGGDGTYYYVIESTDGKVTDIKNICATNSAEFDAFKAASKAEYRLDWVSIVPVGKENRVYFIMESKTAVTGAPAVTPEVQKGTAPIEGAAKDWNVDTDDFIEATVTGTVSTENGAVTANSVATISGVTFEYIGDCEKDMHGVVYGDGNYFVETYYGEHFTDVEAWVDGEELHGAITFETYDAHTGEEVCYLAKKVAINLADAKIKIAAGANKDVEVKIIDNDGDATYTFVLNLAVAAADGKLTATYVAGSKIEKDYDSATATYASTYAYAANGYSTLNGAVIDEEASKKPLDWNWATIADYDASKWLVSDVFEITENIAFRVRAYDVTTDGKTDEIVLEYAYKGVTLDSLVAEDAVFSFGTSADIDYTILRRGTGTDNDVTYKDPKDYADSVKAAVTYTGSDLIQAIVIQPYNFSVSSGNINATMTYFFHGQKIYFTADEVEYVIPLLYLTKSGLPATDRATVVAEYEAGEMQLTFVEKTGSLGDALKIGGKSYTLPLAAAAE